MQVRLLNLLKLTVIGLFLSPSLSADPVSDEVQAIFDNTCIGCHSGGTPSGLLSLDDAEISGTSLIDVSANCGMNNEKLVEPGDPEASVLYLKLASQNPDCDQSMPLGGPLISAADLNTIFDWIVSIGPAAQFGLFSMDQIAITVQETDPSVILIVNRELGTEGEVTVEFSVATVGTDTAVDPTDYIAQTGVLVFAEGETSKEITVVLVDDEEFEGTEVFSVTLTNPAGGAVLGGGVQSKVSIVDNEFDNKPGTFFFGNTSYTVEEDAGEIQVLIIRSFGAAGQVTVDLTSSDGSALNNSDYQTVSSTLVFEEGIKNLPFIVTIVDDDIEEPAESFTLILSNPSGGALLGSSRATVNINDNDAPDGGGEPEPEPEPEPNPEPEEEVEFESAGSVYYLLMLLLLMGGFRKMR